jgi:hypothetical protein
VIFLKTNVVMENSEVPDRANSHPRGRDITTASLLPLGGSIVTDTLLFFLCLTFPFGIKFSLEQHRRS